MAGRFHNGPNGPGLCKSTGARGCPFDPEGTGANHFGSMEEAQEAYEAELTSEHGLVATASRNPRAKAWTPSPHEAALKARNAELARRLVEERAKANVDDGVMTEAEDPAKLERGTRRLKEAVTFAESRGNTALTNKLSKAKVLPSGSFRDGNTRIGTDKTIRTYVADKYVAEGRAEIEGAIQAAIDRGDITEGKYMHRDEAATYSLTVAPGLDRGAYERLPESLREKISSPRQSPSIDLAKEKLPADLYEKITTDSQVMDFVVSKTPDIGQWRAGRPVTDISGDSSESRAEWGLMNLSDWTARTDATFGSKKERTAELNHAKEVIKSSAAKHDGNIFSPGRAYGNGVLVSGRRVLNRAAMEEHLTPAQIKSITRKELAPDPEKARKVLSEADYKTVFERNTASLRVTPKRGK